MNVTEAQKDFASLVNRVHLQGISVDLEQDNKVIARLTPVRAQPHLTAAELRNFLTNLPPLGDDADNFAREIHELARNDGVALDQFIATALAEKVAVLDAERYIQERAVRGNREKFDRVLAKVPVVEPEEGDRFPDKKPPTL